MARLNATEINQTLSAQRCQRFFLSIGGFVPCDGANKSTYQRSQFIKGWNVHYERDIPADFLLTDIEFDMQK